MRFAYIALFGVGWGLGLLVPRTGPDLAPVEVPSPGVAPIEEACDPEPLVQCTARLAAATRPHGQVAVPFDAVPDEDQPERWAEGVADRLCGHPLEHVDCASYPCVGALRRGQLDDCESDDLLAVPVPVRCGDRVEWLDAVLWYDQQTLQSVSESPDDPHDETLLYGLLGQRVEAMARSWPCSD